MVTGAGRRRRAKSRRKLERADKGSGRKALAPDQALHHDQPDRLLLSRSNTGRLEADLIEERLNAKVCSSRAARRCSEYSMVDFFPAVRTPPLQNSILCDLRWGITIKNAAMAARLTAQKKASRERYVDLYDFAPIPYVSFDHTGRVEEANLVATELLGESERSANWTAIWVLCRGPGFAF